MNMMRLRLIERHLAREFLVVQAAVTSLLLLIIIGGVVAGVLREVAEGRLPLDFLPAIVLVGTVRAIILLWPVSLFLAFLLVLGRSQRDSELVAMQATGVSYVQLYRAILVIAVPAAVIIAVLMALLAPMLDQKIEDMRRLAEARSDLVGITPGRFLMSRIGNQVFYGERLADDGQVILNVFLYREHEGKAEVTTAARARADLESGSRHLILEDGHRYVGTPGSDEFEMLDFNRMRIEIPDPALRQVGYEKRGSMPLGELWSLRHERLYRAELEWRLAVPLSVLTLALLALPLGLTRPRSGRYARIPWAILVYVIYVNFMIIGKNWLAAGHMPLVLGLWWAHAIPLLVWAGILLRTGIIRLPLPVRRQRSVP